MRKINHSINTRKRPYEAPYTEVIILDCRTSPAGRVRLRKL